VVVSQRLKKIKQLVEFSQCTCTVQHLREMQFSCFPVLPGSAEVHIIWRGVVKSFDCLLYISNISAKKYQNPSCVKVIASQRWDVFWDTV